MIYIFEGGNYVLDGSTITEEQRREAVVVAKKPTREVIEGKYPVLKWDIENQTAWYEYEDVAKSEPEIQQDLINTLGQELATLKIQLIMGGAI